MPRIIKDRLITQDNWLPVDPEAAAPAPQQICTLTQWQNLADKTGSAVQLEPGDDVSVLSTASRGAVEDHQYNNGD